MGRIDGCFANAGVSQKHGPFHELESAEWKRVLGVNLDGAFYTLRAAARHMGAVRTPGNCRLCSATCPGLAAGLQSCTRVARNPETHRTGAHSPDDPLPKA